MTSFIPLNIVEFLIGNNLNFIDLKQMLEADSSWINKINTLYKSPILLKSWNNEYEYELDILNASPLLLVLKNKRCTAEIIELFIRYNSNVNFKDMNGDSCLFNAIYFSPIQNIIKTLLQCGANVRDQDCIRRSIICAAIQNHVPSAILKLLLKAPPPPLYL